MPLKRGVLKLVLLGLLLAWVYLPTVIWMADRWWAKDSYYGHGPLIPLVSLALLWWRRAELAVLPRTSSRWGWALIALGLALQTVSAVGRIYFTSALSFFVLLAGMVLVWGGWPLLKGVWFPIAFLFFMVPIPLAAVAQVSLSLKLVAARLSAAFLGLLGVPVFQDGSTLHLPHISVLVEDVCSGLRSLIALVALGVLCAYTMRSTWVRRLLLLAVAVPIAVAANVFRITVICLVGELYGEHLITGTFHDAMGYMAFLFAYGLLSAFGIWLRR